MGALTAWLAAVGVADLVAGAGGHATTRWRAAGATGAGAAAAAVIMVAASGRGQDVVGVTLVALVAVAGWMAGRAAATARLAAAVLAAAVVVVGWWVAVALPPGGALPSRAPAEVLAPTPEVLGLVAAVALCLVGTANVVVRLLLRLADVDAVAAGNRLRGGRVIGPLERLVLFGLGLAGGWIAAGFVVAAKSLLRLSELRAGGDPAGPPRSRDERIEVLSEYVLLGSLASWALALAAVGLVRLVA